jgi:hypothetical protein
MSLMMVSKCFGATIVLCSASKKGIGQQHVCVSRLRGSQLLL